MKSAPSRDGASARPADDYARRMRLVERVVRSIVRDPEAARDIAQDVWVRYVERRPEGDDPAGIDRWLATVARNLALNHLASGHIRFRAAVTFEALPLAGGDLSPAETAGRMQEERRVAAVLASLSDRHRDAIRLCDGDGLSYAEAGAILGLSESAVTSLLHRARLAFRRLWLLACAPPWLRSLAEAGPIDEALASIDPLAPPDDLRAAVGRSAHDLFGALADRWDDLRSASTPGDLDAAIADRARLAPDDLALDVGTGTGVVALHVAPYVRRVVGIDRSLGMLRVARDNVARSGRRNVLMEFGDLRELPIRPRSVDVAFCSLVLRLVDRPGESVARIARTIRPGGRIVVCDLLRSPRTGPDGLSPEHLSGWLADAGFGDVAIERIGGRGGRPHLVAVGRRR